MLCDPVLHDEPLHKMAMEAVGSCLDNICTTLQLNPRDVTQTKEIRFCPAAIPGAGANGPYMDCPDTTMLAQVQAFVSVC